MKSLLVGSQFHPPARQLLQHLPTGASVQLRPEPDNPYDSDAIQVFLLRSDEVPTAEHSGLEEDLSGCGWTLDDFLQSSDASICLGHLAKEDGKPLQIWRERNPTEELSGAAAFLEAGLGEVQGRLEWTNFGQDILVVVQRSEADGSSDDDERGD